MRIVFISHRFPPNFLGGADIYTYGIAHELHQRGHRVSVVCAERIADSSVPVGRVRAADEPYDGLPVRRLYFNWQNMPDPYGYLYVLNPLIEKEVSNYLCEVMPNVVHVTACDYVTIGVITAAKCLGLPVVFTLTGKWLICPVATLLRSNGSLCTGRQDGITCHRCLFGLTKTSQVLRKLPSGWCDKAIEWTGKWPRLFRPIGSLNFIHAVERRNSLFPRILNQVDYIISPSHCHRQVFAESGVTAAERIVYSPYGHKTEKAAAGQYKTPSDKVRFGYTGQIVSHKGVDTLVEAFARLDRGAAELHVFGDTELESAFGRKVLSLADENPYAFFHGRFDNKDIGRVLSGIDVVVVPSRCIENAPVTIAEAFSARTPVIGSDVCGIVEYIQHGVNGLLFRRGDPDDLTRQMQRILDEPDLLPRLRESIPPVRTVADEASELESLYWQLGQKSGG